MGVAPIPLGQSAAGFNPQPQIGSLAASASGFTIEQESRKRQDDSRHKIALVIVGSLSGIVLLPFIIIWWSSRDIEALLKLVQATIGPVVGVVGAVTGFYFGSASGQPSSGK